MTDEYTGADLFVDALERYGVSRVFGNPGTTELPVMEAIGDSDLEYVLGLHEDVAVGMAAGYASTRRYHADRAERAGRADGDEPEEQSGGEAPVNPVGVVNLHVAPGLAHGLGNLYGAAVAGAPLVVTAGNHSTDFRHEEPILSGDLASMASEFAKWSDEVRDVSALPAMLRRAFRVALTPPTGPVFLALPLDAMMTPTDADPERLGEIPDAGRGDPTQIERAADLLADPDEDVALVVGDGVARSGVDAVEAAVEFAEAAGARVHGEILACEIDFPTDHDQWVSYIPPDEDLAATLLGADNLVFAGCSTNTTLTRHDRDLVADDTTCVHVSDDAWQVGKNQPADAAVVGDPGRVLGELAGLVRKRLTGVGRDERLDRVEMVKQMAESRMAAMGEDEADDPRASKAELVDAMERVAGDAYVVDEGVTAKYAMLTRWDFAPEQYVSNKGGGLGYGLPAAVGAAIAEGETDDPRDVVGFVGDGSYLYYPQTLYSAARYDADLTVVIPDNRNYRILKDNTLDLFGGEEDDYEFVGMDFEPPVDIPANAESHGARGRLIEDPDEIESALAAALERDGPDVLDVLVHD
ncbi:MULTISPECIES: thiamine pyrophosphate-binding protein [Halorussus]|uniref:thiamine pyrophosphate-binding protein n=1 Tax=Halorussus TaxID=1070314 RepID=UPI000E20E597|nr:MULTISPECIES: thiamine pyrophosphate-binding protein [Halorussus]NHN58799.1 thiamine pyrophosphate-binding protein [Halorussus sp. JP-T4]